LGLLERISARTVNRPSEQRFAADQWISDYLMPTQFGFNGVQYGAGMGLNQTLAGNRATEISATLPGYLSALRSCPPAFAAQLVRALVLSQARFVFRNPPWHPSSPRKTFGSRGLSLLERPWPNATTGELIARMEWHAGLAGNAFVTRRPDRLRVLRPDWVAILYGSHLEPEDPGHALDGELLGYIYQNQGLFTGLHKPQTILPRDMAHWSPIPDPENAGIGMSWITPAVREIQKDRVATQHTINYFVNGATPNMVVKGITAATKEQFDEIVGMMEDNHAGVANAYKTLYLVAGADATVVGSELAAIDLKAVNGASETRIASLSRVHPVILGIAEGLAGSSLNAGNFGMARRIWADSWIYPTLQDLAASLAPLVDVPADAELWTDTGDMPILREDAKDAAEIEQIKASTIVSLVSGGGFTHESSIAAVQGQNMGLLKPIPGWISVQLQQQAGPAGVPPEAAQAGAQAAPVREVLLDVFDETRADHNNLKAYWLTGDGAGKWSTWTELYHHLKKHMVDELAKRTAAEWFHIRYGYWPGADANKVAHGKPPRGKVVGPG